MVAEGVCSCNRKKCWSNGWSILRDSGSRGCMSESWFGKQSSCFCISAWSVGGGLCVKLEQETTIVCVWEREKQQRERGRERGRESNLIFLCPVNQGREGGRERERENTMAKIQLDCWDLIHQDWQNIFGIGADLNIWHWSWFERIVFLMISKM